LILQSWKEGLLEGHLRNSAWSFILNGYSTEFITKYKDRLPAFVDMVVGANDAKKLCDLLVFSHVHISDELYGVPACASKITMPTQVIGATEDRIAGFEPVRLLSERIADSIFCEIKSGHLAPFENPNQWRKLLLDFMSTDAITPIAV
jgi:pimeloyl-ACP methyl ester carboxylesterase